MLISLHCYKKLTRIEILFDLIKIETDFLRQKELIKEFRMRPVFP